MLLNPLLIAATAAAPGAATWNSGWIDLTGAAGASVLITWEDVTVTFYLWRTNDWAVTPAAGTYEDFTAAYRVLDPAWVDPLLGDARQGHIVRFQALGANYYRIGYTGGNWTGGSAYLRLVAWVDRREIER